MFWRMFACCHLRLVALCWAGAQWAAAGSVSALPGERIAVAAAPVVFVARKGTRNYMPDSPPPADASSDGNDAERQAKALADCIAIWDEKTHITKSKWREICHRQLKERGPQLTGH